MVEKVIATPAAVELIAFLKTKHGPELMFHQSGGCCDNSAANCYLPGTFSLEGPEGKAFHTRSRVFSESEMDELDAEEAAAKASL